MGILLPQTLYQNVRDDDAARFFKAETEAPLLTDPEVHRKLRGEAELGTMFALGAWAVAGDRKHAYGLWYLSGSAWEEGPAA